MTKNHNSRSYSIALSSLLLVCYALSACNGGSQSLAATAQPPTLTSTVTATAPPAATAAPNAMVNVNALNVRAGPGTDYERISGVVRGDVLDVIGQAYGCTWLKVITPAGIEGWVSAQYVDLSLDCAQVNEAPIPAKPTLPPTAASTDTPTLAPPETPTVTPAPLTPTDTPALLPQETPTPTATGTATLTDTPVPTLPSAPTPTFTTTATPPRLSNPELVPSPSPTDTPTPV